MASGRMLLAVAVVGLVMPCLGAEPFRAVVRDVTLSGLHAMYSTSSVPGSTHSDGIRSEMARHVQFELIDGDYDLPRDAGVNPATDVIAHVYGGGDGRSLSPLNNGRISRTPISQPPTAIYEYTRAYDLGNSVFLNCSARLGIFPTDAPDEEAYVLRLSAGEENRGTAFDGQNIAILARDGLPFHRLNRLAVTADGVDVEFDYRQKYVAVPIADQPTQVLRTEVALDGQSRTVTGYWNQWYSADIHNTNERFAARLDPPVGAFAFIAVYDNLNMQTLEPEPYLELYDTAFEPLESRAVDTYAKTAVADLDGDGVPADIEGYPPQAGQSHRLLPDSDGDGRADIAEDTNYDGAVGAGETGARDPDSDDDGIEDGVEFWLLDGDPLDPQRPADKTDADGDTLPASVDPNDGLRDTDGDQYLDGYEYAVYGLDAVEDSETTPPLGDINNDGAVSNVDALAAQSLFLSRQWPDGFRPGNADAFRDGLISNVDPLAIQAKFLGTAALPLGPP